MQDGPVEAAQGGKGRIGVKGILVTGKPVEQGLLRQGRRLDDQVGRSVGREVSRQGTSISPETAFASYEKRREVFDLGGAHIALDELPYGPFVEIEAPTLEEVRRAASALGLDWERRVQVNYLALFDEFRNRLNLSFSDATFANFEGIPRLRPEEIGLKDAIQAIDGWSQ